MDGNVCWKKSELVYRWDSRFTGELNVLVVFRYVILSKWLTILVFFNRLEVIGSQYVSGKTKQKNTLLHIAIENKFVSPIEKSLSVILKKLAF